MVHAPLGWVHVLFQFPLLTLSRLPTVVGQSNHMTAHWISWRKTAGTDSVNGNVKQ
jgi:hypothetical protein